MNRAARLGALLIASLALPVAAGRPEVETPPEHRRGAEQTFLTYPEWFLVFSPAEYADFLQAERPSDFPYFGHIRQFWQGYGAVAREIRGKYPPNYGYHVMIMVIGLSTTGEYALKSAYETLVGRLTELTRTSGMTEEDRYAADVARDYERFIRIDPWYKYDFISKLKGLWTDTNLWGRDPLRKWERKYFLTTEYALKAVYGQIIKVLTHAAYDEALPVTAVVLDRLPDDLAMRIPELKLLGHLPNGSSLVTLPRYEPFMSPAADLAEHGAHFLEIAGNRGEILVSVVGPADGATAFPGRAVIIQPILTRPGLRRVVFAVPVADLAQTLDHARPPYRVEHIYDY